MYEENTIYSEDMRPDVAEWCNTNGQYHIESVAEGEGFTIVPNSQPTEKELEEYNRIQAEAEAEAQRVPDLEDATVELADYIVSLEERIAELEARLNG